MSHPAYLPAPLYRYAEERYFVREWTSRAEISPGLLWAQRRRRLRRNEPPGINVGAKERVRPSGGPKGSKSMGGAPAQGKAIQPGASEPANSLALQNAAATKTIRPSFRNHGLSRPRRAMQ
jgi:hypothetical protein